MNSLSELIADPELIAAVDLAAVPALLAHLASVQSALTARLLNGQREPRELLTVVETARRMGVSQDWLYRNADSLPFALRLSRKQLRFEARGLEAYLVTRGKG